MNPILATEDAIIAGAKAALGFSAVPPAPVVRQVETLPGNWTIETLKRALQFAPGVYVTFLGGQAGADSNYLNARFALYVVTKGAREEDRRHGNQRVIGAYEIVSRLAPRLASLRIAEIGTLSVKSVENVFSEAMFELGGTVYALTLELPNMPWPDDTAYTAGTLEDFVTFHGEHRFDPTSPQPDAVDEVTLPQ